MLLTSVTRDPQRSVSAIEHIEGVDVKGCGGSFRPMGLNDSGGGHVERRGLGRR
jgi:hypothetical protein